MITKRIIPCLDIKDGQTVKGINFVDLRSAGDPVELAKAYVLQGADELVFLDITATIEGRRTFVELVKKIGQNINIPFTVGGGINSIEDVGRLLQAGADKISINSSAVKNPTLIDQLAAEFGAQCVVIAIDTRFHEHGFNEVYVHGGRTPTGINTIEWAKEVQERGAGEILLTSMDHDGTKQGFALDITGTLATTLSIPIIASGGAGTKEHFEEVFRITQCEAALAASVFHFGEIPIPELKFFLREKDIPVRL